MGRKEFIDPETADWPIRGGHVVAPVGLGLSSPPVYILILPASVPARWSLPHLLRKISEPNVRLLTTLATPTLRSPHETCT